MLLLLLLLVLLAAGTGAASRATKLGRPLSVLLPFLLFVFSLSLSLLPFFLPK